MTSISRLRLVAINDVYELKNLPKLQTFLSKLTPAPSAVILAGDCLSPSTLSSIDGGRGMVDSLRASGVSHMCLGNHEADLPLSTLRDRVSELSKSVTLINTNMRKPPASASWLVSSLAPPYSIITTPCERVKVAMLGLMSDEGNVFRDGSFKGVPIDNVLSSFSQSYEALVPDLAHYMIPITHQSMIRDRDLAQHMLDMNIERGLIFGGHEHEPFDESIQHATKQEHSVRILKSGCNAKQASLVDLDFDVSVDPPRLVELSASFVKLSEYEDSVVVRNIVEKHMAVIKNMENEIIIDDTMIPPGIILSSERSRYSQTTVGAFLCQAIKEELEVDVAIINGASIAGDTTYDDNRLSYAQLKNELPFPTKMVVVPMTRGELQDAIYFSHTYSEDDGDKLPKNEVPRKGYLQTDFSFNDVIGDQSDELLVALPRNLMRGFCNNKPLIELGKQLKDEFPGEDDYIPAVDLVTRYCCKNRWASIVQGDFSFDEFDLNHDGSLDRAEIKAGMTRILGHEPPDFVVDDMIKSIDDDDNGVVDRGELAHVLAKIERNSWRET